MAVSASLPMVEDNKNPSLTTTYGEGEIIRDALDHGVNKVIVGLAKSATNDAGCGLASALGVSFYDKNNDKFIPVGRTLDKVAQIDLSTMDKRLSKVTITTMCDVDNPFYGPDGTAVVYGSKRELMKIWYESSTER